MQPLDNIEFECCLGNVRLFSDGLMVLRGKQSLYRDFKIHFAYSTRSCLPSWIPPDCEIHADHVVSPDGLCYLFMSHVDRRLRLATWCSDYRYIAPRIPDRIDDFELHHLVKPTFPRRHPARLLALENKNCLKIMAELLKAHMPPRLSLIAHGGSLVVRGYASSPLSGPSYSYGSNYHTIVINDQLVVKRSGSGYYNGLHVIGEEAR